MRMQKILDWHFVSPSLVVWLHQLYAHRVRHSRPRNEWISQLHHSLSLLEGKHSPSRTGWISDLLKVDRHGDSTAIWCQSSTTSARSAHYCHTGLPDRNGSRWAHSLVAHPRRHSRRFAHSRRSGAGTVEARFLQAKAPTEDALLWPRATATEGRCFTLKQPLSTTCAQLGHTEPK